MIKAILLLYGAIGFLLFVSQIAGDYFKATQGDEKALQSFTLKWFTYIIDDLIWPIQLLSWIVNTVSSWGIIGQIISIIAVLGVGAYYREQ